MNKLHLVLSLLFAGNCFASQGSEIDSARNSPGIANLVSAVSVVNPMSLPGGFAVQAKKPCEKPIRCQMYKYAVMRYNQEHNVNMFYPEVDEVEDSILQQELKNLVQLFDFKDQYGKIIEPEITLASGRLGLPLLKNGNECPDYLIARSIIDPLDQVKPQGPLGLLERYNFIKNN